MTNMNWEEMNSEGDKPPAIFGHSTTVIGKTRVVLFGGVDANLIMNNSVYIFSVYNSKWLKIQRNLYVNNSHRKSTLSKSGTCSHKFDAFKNGNVWWGCWRYII